MPLNETKKSKQDYKKVLFLQVDFEQNILVINKLGNHRIHFDPRSYFVNSGNGWEKIKAAIIDYGLLKHCKG